MVTGLYLITFSFIILCIHPIYFRIDIENIKITDKNYINTSSQKLSIFKEKEKTIKKKTINKSYISQLKEIFSNKFTVISMLINSILTGEITTINFWIGDYMRTIYNINQKEVFYTFCFMSIGGPICSIFANMLISKYVGEYDSSNGHLAMLFTVLCNTVFALYLPFTESFYSFLIVSTFTNLFLSICDGNIHGIIAHSVEPELRAIALSSNRVITMVFFSGPFTMLYGYMSERYKHINNKLGMISITSFIILACILAFVLYCMKDYKSIDHKNEQSTEGTELISNVDQSNQELKDKFINDKD